MFRRERLAAVVALALAMPVAGAAGPIIFDNGVGTPQYGVQLNGRSPWTLADDFQLSPGHTTIGDVHWTGFYETGFGAASDQFTIRIYADDGGLPTGSALTTQTVTPVRSVFVNVGSLQLFAYDADIVPVALAANTTYWLGIDWVDTSYPEPGLWRWMANLPLNGNALYGDGLQWSRIVGGDSGEGVEFDFRLTEPVPEPAALALLGLALTGVAARRRSARRTAARKCAGVIE